MTEWSDSGAKIEDLNFAENKKYDYDNNLDKNQKAYIDAENKLQEINEKLKAENIDEKIKRQLTDEKNEVLKEIAAARLAMGKDREGAQLFDIETGARVDKITKPNHVDLTEQINKEKENY